MSLSRMASVDYLVGHVAAGDSMAQSTGTPLTRYYTAEGYPPGTWLGTGLVSLGAAEMAGSEVTEEQLADNPESATDEDKAKVAAQLRRLAVIAPGESATAARDAIRTVADIQHTADRETTLAAARQSLASAIVTSAIDETGTESITSDATQRWLDALETLLPAGVAIDRAAAIAAARSAAVERRVAVQHRHPDVDRLLASEENSDWETDSARLD